MIRKATVFDANELTIMWDEMCEEVMPRASIREEYNNVTNLFINMVARIESPDWCVAVYDIDGYRAGFVMGRIRYPQYNRCHVICECEVVYVKPEYRNMGIHKELIEEGAKWGRDNNATQFEFSGPYNESLMRFWDKLGYEPVIVTYRQKEAI